MTVKKISSTEDTVTFEVTFSLQKSMLEAEEHIQGKLNELGTAVTGEALKQFDTDGSIQMVGPTKFATKGLQPKIYQTPYGEVTIQRHVYQGPKGGVTYCPLEVNARMVRNSTPRFAKQISYKYAEMAVRQVQTDLDENHGRHVTKRFLQDMADIVGTAVQAKEESWEYTPPKLEEPVKTVSVGLDGTTVLLSKEGYREAMVGTVSSFNEEGERLNTTYVAAPPEYGKEQFKLKLERLINVTKGNFPNAKFIGLADGAKTNWEFLKQHTSEQTLDFWHATEYLAEVAGVLHANDNLQRRSWLKEKSHELKHKSGTADKLIAEVEKFSKTHKLTIQDSEKVHSFLTYYRNNKHMMNYSERLNNKEPIGSGVTEAACKVIVKQRLGRSGAQWKNKGAGITLSLRALSHSTGYWKQFWGKVDQYGFPQEI